MAPYLAAVRNYWALLPAIAVIVVLILVYAVPTLINPQWTSSILALFRQHPVDPQATQDEAQRAAGVLGPQQIRSRRMLAVAMVVGAVALIGFNVSLNREANGCYIAARAFGAVERRQGHQGPVHQHDLRQLLRRRHRDDRGDEAAAGAVVPAGPEEEADVPEVDPERARTTTRPTC